MFSNFVSYLSIIQFNSAAQKFEDEETVDDLTLVLNDDKTEVNDEEYFQTLADKTVFVIVHAGCGGRSCSRYRNRDK